jgi:hypothetical protein
MRHPKIILAGIGAALAAAGGTYAAVATSSAPGSTPPAATAPAAASGSATVRVANALVVGKTEAILTTASGLPLYYYGADRSGTSLVSGQLAALAAADVGCACGHRAEWQAHRGQRRPRQPTRLQRPPALHLHV